MRVARSVVRLRVKIKPRATTCSTRRVAQLVAEADGLHRRNLDREQVLNRLWEIANLSEVTRGSVTGQVKAFHDRGMENFIPTVAPSPPEKKYSPGSRP